MSQLKIESGIPVPPITARQGSNIMLLKAMKVGDSVYFDAPIVKKAVRFYRVAQKLGIKVIIRKDARGMRMWRVSDQRDENANTFESMKKDKKAHVKVAKIGKIANSIAKHPRVAKNESLAGKHDGARHLAQERNAVKDRARARARA